MKKHQDTTNTTNVVVTCGHTDLQTPANPYAIQGTHAGPKEMFPKFAHGKQAGIRAQQLRGASDEQVKQRTVMPRIPKPVTP